MAAPILVTGAHRSGSTWVGRMLASHGDVCYIDEPLNLTDTGPAQVYFQYIDQSDPEPFAGYIREHIESVAPQRALVKDPMALMSADWLAETFEMRVVVTIRHPAAFASSIKVLNWSTTPTRLLHRFKAMPTASPQSE